MPEFNESSISNNKKSDVKESYYESLDKKDLLKAEVEYKEIEEKVTGLYKKIEDYINGVGDSSQPKEARKGGDPEIYIKQIAPDFEKGLLNLSRIQEELFSKFLNSEKSERRVPFDQQAEILSGLIRNIKERNIKIVDNRFIMKCANALQLIDGKVIAEVAPAVDEYRRAQEIYYKYREEREQNNEVKELKVELKRLLDGKYQICWEKLEEEKEKINKKVENLRSWEKFEKLMEEMNPHPYRDLKPGEDIPLRYS